MPSPASSIPAHSFQEPDGRVPGRKLSRWRFPVTIAVLMATLIATWRVNTRTAYELVRPLESIPSRLAGWQFVADEPVEADVVSVLAATSFLSRSYERNGDRLSLFIAYYAAQHGGRAVHSPKNCLPGNGWEIRDRKVLRLQAGSQPVEVNQYLIQHTGTRLTLLYWYQSRNRIIADEYLGKFLLLRDALWEGRSANSSVRIVVPPTEEAAGGAAEFASALVVSLRESFGDAPVRAAIAPVAPKS